MREVKLWYYQVHNSAVIGPELIKKEGIISIGRTEDNDISHGYKFISRKHGKVYFEENTSQFYYEDFSTLGTTILHWDKENGLKAESEYVKNRKVMLNPGDWIMITLNGLNGVIIRLNQ